MQEIYSGGEPIKAEIITVENVQEWVNKNWPWQSVKGESFNNWNCTAKAHKTGGGKAFKAIIFLIGNKQGWRKELVVVKR